MLGNRSAVESPSSQHRTQLWQGLLAGLGGTLAAVFVPPDTAWWVWSIIVFVVGSLMALVLRSPFSPRRIALAAVLALIVGPLLSLVM